MIIAFWSGKAVGVNKRLLWNPRLKRNVPNPKYKAFKESMAWAIVPHKEVITGLVDVKLSVSLWKMMDSDSVMKPCLDAIEASGLIKNDSQVKNITIEREYHKRGELDRIGFFISEVKES